MSVVRTLTRKRFMKLSGAALAGATLAGCAPGSKAPAPNVVWITAEDMCPELGCYGNRLVTTPNIDRLAAQGVRFSHAFATAPVCSAVRSATITGMYQTSIGAHNHRSHRDDGYTLPHGIKLVTDYFREAGYFTALAKGEIAPGAGTNAKTDFNFQAEKPFDGSDWNQRQAGQPFFIHINFQEAHRGPAWDRARKRPNLVDPARVELPPYYADHPVVRDDWANYLDSINLLDEKVGAVLQRLEDEGLVENTIVFFFADHGRCLFRGKQFCYDGGLHIPLIVRWPGQLKAGSVNGQLVNNIDITATALQLAGITPPEHMEGRVILGKKAAKEREYVVSARDRCDETVDRIRSVRTRRYKYIRNFYPERPYSQLNRYKESRYAPLPLMRQLHKDGKLTPAQALFFAPTRPKEELYDLQNDPHEVHNLADSPERQKILKRLRGYLERWIEETGDLGAIPEPQEITDGWEAMQKRKYEQ